MSFLTSLLLAACVVGLVLSITLAIRNEQVFRYRQKIIYKMFEMGTIEIGAGIDFKRNERLAIYDSVPYNDMLYHFWRPLKSFYPPDWDVLKEVE